MLKKTLLTLTVLALASLTAFAGDNDAVVTSKDGRTTISTAPAQHVIGNRTSDAGLITIFDNIGTAYPNGEYWCCTGATITGPSAIQNFPEYWEAAAFTPKADHTITKIEVAVGYVEGNNGIVLGLYDDASGVPGTPIKAWPQSGLPTFGSCCVVDTQALTKGVPVKANTQYWIVMKAGAKDANTWAAWNLNDVDQVDAVTSAYYCSDDHGGSCNENDAWVPETAKPGFAFAVLGK